MQLEAGNSCCSDEKRKMKRSIDICSKCEKFHHDDHRMICLASEDGLLHFVSEKLGIPKDFFFGEEDVAGQGMEDDFSEKDVPDDCEMKTEYCMDEWNKAVPENCEPCPKPKHV